MPNSEAFPSGIIEGFASAQVLTCFGPTLFSDNTFFGHPSGITPLVFFVPARYLMGMSESPLNAEEEKNRFVEICGGMPPTEKEIRDAFSKLEKDRVSRPPLPYRQQISDLPDGPLAPGSFSHLNKFIGQKSTSAPNHKTANAMKPAFVIGFIVIGAILAFLVFQPGRYYIGESNSRSMKIDRWTGDTWIMRPGSVYWEKTK